MDNEIIFFLSFSLATLSTNPHNNGCLWDNKWCFNKWGQCGIYEDEVETKCAQWDMCGGVLCADEWVQNGRKFCIARDALDSGTFNSVGYAYRKVRGPTANCDKMTSTPAGIHIYKNSGDMGLRSEESKGFGWVEVTFPPTKISRIIIQQWDTLSSDYKLIVRSGKLHESSSTTVDECNQFCTDGAPECPVEKDSNGFTYHHYEEHALTEVNHGDVCRKGTPSSGGDWWRWECPTHCNKVAGLAQPYCTDKTSGAPCRKQDPAKRTSCTAFTYSEQRGSCKTFKSCPYLTKTNSDGKNYGLGKFDSETFVKGKFFFFLYLCHSFFFLFFFFPLSL